MIRYMKLKFKSAVMLPEPKRHTKNLKIPNLLINKHLLYFIILTILSGAIYDWNMT